jgi:hypothetical protein
MGTLSATAAACGGSIVIVTSGGGGDDGDAATSDDGSLGGGSSSGSGVGVSSSSGGGSSSGGWGSSGGAFADAPDQVGIPVYGGFNVGNPPPPYPDAATADAARADAGVIQDAAPMNDVVEYFDAVFGAAYGGFTGALYGGVCVPGATQCSGNGYQTCSNTGTWGAAIPCGSLTCVNGACR